MGGRPFLPDGLPVIDRVPEHDNAFAATGHGMLGVTLGAGDRAPLGRVYAHRPPSRGTHAVPLRPGVLGEAPGLP
ncbi:FAD-dependent oxidoreductase [Streptomyces sp. NPDC096013]|uniref:FAD-dependent oxidoreductase n=1 Tax=Streptomyces sp. NPDC096013 TaxID=3366069 RepID=UPI003819CB63